MQSLHSAQSSVPQILTERRNIVSCIESAARPDEIERTRGNRGPFPKQETSRHETRSRRAAVHAECTLNSIVQAWISLSASIRSLFVHRVMIGRPTEEWNFGGFLST